MADLYKSIKIYGEYLGMVKRTKYMSSSCRGKTVLHVGCADYPITNERIKNGTLLHLELVKTAKECLGIDLSEEGIKILKLYDNNVRVFNGELIHKLNKKFDVIVASDVLEHMTNPGELLKNVPSCLTDNGELIISVPNAYSWNILKYIVLGFEPTHMDHCYQYSVKTLSELCRRFDLAPVELAFTTQPADESVGNLFLIIRYLLIKICPKMAPSMIMKYRRIKDCESGRQWAWK